MTRIAATIIRFESYDETEDVEQNLEKFEMFLTANGVEKDKKVGVHIKQH